MLRGDVSGAALQGRALKKQSCRCLTNNNDEVDLGSFDIGGNPNTHSGLAWRHPANYRFTELSKRLE